MNWWFLPLVKQDTSQKVGSIVDKGIWVLYVVVDDSSGPRLGVHLLHERGEHCIHPCSCFLLACTHPVCCLLGREGKGRRGQEHNRLECSYQVCWRNKEKIRETATETIWNESHRLSICLSIYLFLCGRDSYSFASTKLLC